MDEKDSVFARFKGAQPETTDRHERITILRPTRASGSRVVEVVRVRGTTAAADKPRRVDTHVRALFWDGGFPAKRSSSAGPLVEGAAAAIAETVVPVTHVMPAWLSAPTPPASDAAPAQAAEPPLAPRRRRGRPRAVITAWEPTPAPAPAPPFGNVATAPAEEASIASRRRRGRPRKDPLSAPARRVADPFDANDDRANCMRCGYAIDPRRESRGLMTCAECG